MQAVVRGRLDPWARYHDLGAGAMDRARPHDPRHLSGPWRTSPASRSEACSRPMPTAPAGLVVDQQGTATLAWSNESSGPWNVRTADQPSSPSDPAGASGPATRSRQGWAQRCAPTPRWATTSAWAARVRGRPCSSKTCVSRDGQNTSTTTWCIPTGRPESRGRRGPTWRVMATSGSPVWRSTRQAQRLSPGTGSEVPRVRVLPPPRSCDGDRSRSGRGSLDGEHRRP